MELNLAHTIVAFECVSDAFAFKEAAQLAGIEGRLRTIPRQISAGCGTAWDSPPGWHEAILKLVDANSLCVEGIHLL